MRRQVDSKTGADAQADLSKTAHVILLRLLCPGSCFRRQILACHG